MMNAIVFSVFQFLFEVREMVTLSIYVPYVCSDTIVRAYMD